MLEQILAKIASDYSSFSPVIALFVFFIYIIIDGLYAVYCIKLSEKNAIASANYGGIMHLFLAFGVISYISNYLYILPLVLGSWIGTYLVVKKQSKK